jgi:hypothetical protein
MAAYSLRRAGQEDLDELLVLMRACCDFYAVSPSDAEDYWLRC